MVTTPVAELDDGNGPAETPRRFRVAIIGAGISGICAAIQLDRSGLRDFTVLEKASRIGGTWRDNTYPGAACDVPAHLYSYSFAPNPDWTSKFAGQEEILAYLERCANEAGIMDRVRFGAGVVRASFDAGSKSWRVELQDGEVVSADILISAVGQLHQPYVPDIPGRDSFSGPSFHSARWRHDVDLGGKSVAMVGSAASAVQIACAIAPTVRRLTIFQRSPNWIAARSDWIYPGWLKRLWRSVPFTERLYRWYLFLRHDVLILVFRTGGPINWIVRTQLSGKIKRRISDEEKRRQLTPDYPPGCKRVLRSPGFLHVLSYDEPVKLVSDPVDRIVPEGVVTKSGVCHPADVIVYATGFAASSLLDPVEVVGRDGTRLRDAWQDGPEAYLGMAVPKFPNFFMLYGPNTNLGHNSIILMIEDQCRYIDRLLAEMMGRGAACCEVRPEALKRHQARLLKRFPRTVWSAGCNSYYVKDRKIFSIWPFSTARYWLQTRRPRLSDYSIE